MRRLTVLLVAGLLAGCGGGDGGGGATEKSGDDLLKQAAAKMESLESYRATADFSSSGGQSFEMQAEIVGTTDGKRSRVVGDFKQGEQAVKLEMLRFGLDEYISSDAFPLPAGKKWIRGSDDTPSSSLPLGDFMRYLGGAKGFEKKGTETIDGAATTHFGGPFDLKDFTAKAGPEAAASFKRTAGAENIAATLDVWIDEEAEPVRLAMGLKPKSGGGDSITMRMDIEEYGVPIDFKVPPKSEVADPSALGG